MSDRVSAFEKPDWEQVKGDFASRRRSLRHRSARIFATCAQGAWLLLAVTPVIVVICAIKG